MHIKKSFYKITGIVPILVALCLPLATTAARAAGVTLRWDPNTPTPEGYRAFARRSDQAYNYSRPDWEGSAVTCNLNNLEEQAEYYFVVRAYDGYAESADSDEVRYVPSQSAKPGADTTSPSWNRATLGIGLAADAASGGRVTVEFDTARDKVDDADLKFNVYYEARASWDNGDWTNNSVVVDAAVSPGSTFAHSISVRGLSNGVAYTFGVRAEDQSGNEDTNTTTMTATPSTATVPDTSTKSYRQKTLYKTAKDRSGIEDTKTTTMTASPSTATVPDTSTKSYQHKTRYKAVYDRRRK